MVITTERQKKAADEILRQVSAKQKPNMGKALIKAGYSKETSESPALVTKSKGFLAYLSNAGLDEVSFANYLAEDLAIKPGNRLGELTLLARVLGLTNQTVDVNVQRVDEGINLLRNIIDGEIVSAELVKDESNADGTDGD